MVSLIMGETGLNASIRDICKCNAINLWFSFRKIAPKRGKCNHNSEVMNFYIGKDNYNKQKCAEPYEAWFGDGVSLCNHDHNWKLVC